MGQVLIRNLDDGVPAALRARAAARGVSLEAELQLRDVLTRVAASPRRALVDEFAAIRALTPAGPRRLAEDLVREGENGPD